MLTPSTQVSLRHLQWRASDPGSPLAACLKRGERYCLPVCTDLGQNPTDTKFRGSCRSPPDSHTRSVHPHYLSVYASTADFGDPPYTTSATLDTGPVASSYPGGISPRSSSRPCQSARACGGYHIVGSPTTGEVFKPVCHQPLFLGNGHRRPHAYVGDPRNGNRGEVECRARADCLKASPVAKVNMDPRGIKQFICWYWHSDGFSWSKPAPG